MSYMGLDQITTGKIARPLRISIYGTDGVGKSDLAAGAPAPIFIATEDGTHHLDVARFPVPRNWSDVMGPEGAIQYLYYGEHAHQTVVVDSLDWAEDLCDKFLVEQYNQDARKTISAITDIPYGQWKMLKMVEFTKLLDWLSALLRDRNMQIILISHANIVRFDDPERDAYERYEIKLFKGMAAKVREWSDYNLFFNFDSTTRQVGEGFQERQIGNTLGQRLLLSQRRAAYDAKARWPISDRLDVTTTRGGPSAWDIFWAEHVRASTL